MKIWPLLFLLFGNQDLKVKQLCLQFHGINTKVRDGKIKKQEANKAIHELLLMLDSAIESKADDSHTHWAFPVLGYGLKAVGGKKGNGYLPKGYRYLDGNRHKGHPAHDIFISDRNLDGLDDRTGKEVPIISMFSGWVVSVETNWDAKSTLRGGLYVMIYNPDLKALAYYAHLKSVKVEIGQKIQKGEVLGNMGRTGLNAFKMRSPTHLHVMCLKPNLNLGFEPIDPYKRWLDPG